MYEDENKKFYLQILQISGISRSLPEEIFKSFNYVYRSIHCRRRNFQNGYSFLVFVIHWTTTLVSVNVVDNVAKTKTSLSFSQ